MKKRLDVLLVERGLAETRSQAQALVLAGLVPGYDKAGAQVAEDAPLEVIQRARFVSRGGDKLDNALEAFAIDVAGLDCLDVGASTGGFSDCLLQRGAARVIALDVGYGQLHPKLRSDPRVAVHERVNARGLSPVLLGERVGCAVADLSFISLRLVLPALVSVLLPQAFCAVLVKPQFEAGRAEVGKGGVVRDPLVHARVVAEVVEVLRGLGMEPLGSTESPLVGPAGNHEFLVAARRK